MNSVPTPGGGADVGLSYIRGRYNVPARRGGRIAFAYPAGTVRTGIIVGSSDAHLVVDFPDQRGAILHPTWKVTYLKPLDGVS